MRAAILVVGSELLGSDRVDTNSLRIAEVVRRYGFEVGVKVVVGDEEEVIARHAREELARSELLLVSGGLGPTSDDVTREGVAAALGRTLERDEAIERAIEERFRHFEMRMPEVNRRQADVVAGAAVLENPRGTAPGQRIEEEGRTIFLLPGVPRELEGMLDEQVEPWLRERFTESAVESRYVRVALPESSLEEKLAPYYERFGREGLTILASGGDLTVSVTRRGGAGRRAQLEERLALLEELLEGDLYGREREATLQGAVGELLREAGLTLVTAESCTGGLVAELLTRVPGSSDYFLGGVVSYANPVKVSALGVRPQTLERYGAVSEQVVREMAAGARDRLGADLAVAISGVAGPGGGSEQKPVGTVHVALAGPDEGWSRHRRFQLPGDRDFVRRLAALRALDMVRRRVSDRLAERAVAG